jgi:hypothetical protein
MLTMQLTPRYRILDQLKVHQEISSVTGLSPSLQKPVAGPIFSWLKPLQTFTVYFLQIIGITPSCLYLEEATVSQSV